MPVAARVQEREAGAVGPSVVIDFDGGALCSNDYEGDEYGNA